MPVEMAQTDASESHTRSSTLHRALPWLKDFWTLLWIRRVVLGLGLALLALSLLEFPTTAFDLNHDRSSHASFDYFAAHHFQFGQQIYQNVGPYGYVHYAATYSGYLRVQKILLVNACRLAL